MADRIIQTGTLTAIANAIRSKNGSSDTYTPAQMVTAIENISGVDDTVRTFSAVNTEAAAYIAEVTYPEGSTGTQIANYVTGATTQDDPAGYALTITIGGTIYFTDETDGSGWADTVSAGTYNVYNLIPGHIYRFAVKNVSGVTTQTGRIQASGGLRMLYMDNIRNFRDLGGWACDGGTIQYGKLLRGAQTVYAPTADDLRPLASAADIKRLRDWGVMCEVELRGWDEFHGTSSIIGSDVQFYNVDLGYYADAARINGTYIADTFFVLHTIVDNVIHGIPTYFHCAAGADRTATVAYLLEGILGVSSSDQDKDYELTSFYNGYERLRTRAEYQALVSYINSIDGDTRRDKFIQWAICVGFTVDELNAFRAAAIDGTPDVLDPSDYIVSCTVTYQLTNVASSSAVGSVDPGDAYSTTLTWDSTIYYDPTVTVTMGGMDITASAYNGSTGVISIASVMGDVVITAAAAARPVNLLPLLTDENGNPYNGGQGYKQGYRINSSGSEVAQSDSYCTGFIPIRVGQTIRFDNMHVMGTQSAAHGTYEDAMLNYNASKTKLYNANSRYWVTNASSAYDLDANGYITSLTFKSSGTYQTNSMVYLRVSCSYIGSNAAIYVE